jgi:hypothetical protein
VVREGTLKLIWDKREEESIFAEGRLEMKNKLATSRQSASEKRFMAYRTGV